MSISLSSRSPAGDIQMILDAQSALDIGAFLVDGVDLAPGSAIPSDGDPRIDHALQGFLFTCGPDHIRHPEPVEGFDDGRRFPLHGSLCATPIDRIAMLPPPGTPGCRAETTIRLANTGSARMTRCIAIDPDTGEVMLTDRLLNIGAIPFPPMLMVHINLKGRLLGDATRITGPMLPDGSLPWRFGAGESAHVCLPADSHTDGTGWAGVSLGPLDALGGKSLHVRFRTDTLPFLQMWRCQRGSADVISIEPVSHRIASRRVLTEAGELPLLHPGQSKAYAVAFRVE